MMGTHKLTGTSIKGEYFRSYVSFTLYMEELEHLKTCPKDEPGHSSLQFFHLFKADLYNKIHLSIIYFE